MNEELFSFERKLKLLKESYDAGVIDAEEYSRNKEKLEKQIETLQQQETSKLLSDAEEKEDEEIENAVDAPVLEEDVAPELDIDSESDEVPSLDEQKVESQTPLDDTHYEPEFVSADEILAASDSSSAKEEPNNTQDEKTEEVLTPSEEKRADILIDEAESGPLPQDTEEMHKTHDIPHHEEIHHEEKQDHTFAIAMWIVGALLLLGLLLYASFTLQSIAPNETHNEHKEEIPIACFEHADCTMRGMESLCVNGGTVNATCRYQNATAINLTVIGAGECALCSSERMENILMNWFPGARVIHVNATSSEGLQLQTTHRIEMFPAFVLSSNVENTLLFSEVQNALRKSGSRYVVKDSATGAALFLNRNNAPDRINVFLAPDEEASKRAILNLEEFVLAFELADVQYHIVKQSNTSEVAACVIDLAPQQATEFLVCAAKNEAQSCLEDTALSSSRITNCVSHGDGSAAIAQDASLQRSLGMQVPSMLINNRMKMGGVQAADMIREAYCSMNSDSACSISLRQNLV